MDVRRRLTLFAVTIAATPLAVGACTVGQREAVKPGHGKAAKVSLSVTPADRTKDVPISSEVGTKVSGGKITAVKLVDDKGRQVPAEPREDGSSWVPKRPLENSRTYTAEVTATGGSGRTTTQKTTFSTIGKSTTRQAVTSELLFTSNRTYGTAMPVVVTFDPPIPKEARADVQRRLFVKTDPPQPGTWSWVLDGKQAEYRAPDFWKSGTKISVRSALQGLPIGKDAIGDVDHSATSKIGRQVSLDIDNATKQMSVYRDGKLLRKVPVSMGKPSTPTSSGKMVIMEKFEQTTFDTRGSADPYVVDVEDAQRLTWGGEFIHSAPWSEGDQGSTNVSHGCTNVSAVAADWLMGVTHVGDLVTIKGTEVKLDQGNGFTAWNVSWDEFAKGSALPVPAGLKPAPHATAHPGAVAGGSPPAPAPSKSNSGG